MKNKCRTVGVTGVLVLGCVVCMLTAVPVSAEDFNWSWEDGKGEQTGSVAQTENPGAEFNWEWQDGEDGNRQSASTSDARQTGWGAAAPARREEPSISAIDPAAYNDLMKENLELRKQVSEKERLAETAARKAERLEKEKTTLQGQLNTLASTIDSLEDQKAAVVDDSGRVKELEAKLAEAENEKARLSRNLAELERAVEEEEEKTVEAPAEPMAEPGPTAGVQPGSDLFRQMQEENAQLKQRLAELEDSRAKVERLEEKADQVVERSREKEEDLKSQLKAAKETTQDQKKVIVGLLKRIPTMESELERLRARAGGEESVLAARERELENIREELRRREYRMIKAERMAAMLSEAREEVKVVTDEQQRNMHYNMAVVYAKEGRIREAETEYLRALRIDPTDAAAHYNIAILYDDELHNKKRAAMHYRKYLQLSPDAPDRDEVRQWIMRLEM